MKERLGRSLVWRKHLGYFHSALPKNSSAELFRTTPRHMCVFKKIFLSCLVVYFNLRSDIGREKGDPLLGEAILW